MGENCLKKGILIVLLSLLCLLIVVPNAFALDNQTEIAVNDIAKERYTAIGDYARQKGVTIAFENLKYTKNLEYIMSIVPDAKFCWDCGHEYSRLVDDKPMPLFGKKLAALHIHDNFFTQDKHLIPFTGKIDFENVGKQLAESGYDGTLMLEILYGGNEENSVEPTYKDYALKAKRAAEKKALAEKRAAEREEKIRERAHAKANKNQAHSKKKAEKYSLLQI